MGISLDFSGKFLIFIVSINLITNIKSKTMGYTHYWSNGAIDKETFEEIKTDAIESEQMQK